MRDNLTTAEDNTLTFSETPTSQLALTDYNIYLQNKSIDFSYSKKQGDTSLSLVYLEFTDASGVASETNSILEDKVLQVQLYEYDPSAEEAKQL